MGTKKIKIMNIDSSSRKYFLVEHSDSAVAWDVFFLWK